MKRFLCALIPITLIVLAAGYWGLAHSFPIPGNDPRPNWYVDQQELAGHVFNIVILPARWSGQAAIFVGAAIWAFLPSLVFVFLWRKVFRS